ncbi:MAG: methionyl-tRNA formyltransferase [Candidatus Gracilibacteria bacterium]
MQPYTLIFFSTGEISIPLFEKLLVDSRFKILGLVCQPDRSSGRDLEIQEKAIKKLALNASVAIYQPEKLSIETALLDQFEANPPDFLLSFSYGQILSEDWLALPKIAPLNVHPSLLPKFRGPTPIQSAILNGETESGITLMKMSKGMDEGPIAFQFKIKIPAHVSSALLFDDFAQMAAEKIPDAIAQVAEGVAVFKEQDTGAATVCKLIEREDGRIDFKESAQKIMNQFRAYTPWPGIFATYQGKRLKLLDIEIADEALEPGKVHCTKHEILIGTSDGALKVKLLQLEGKTVLHPEAFIAGQPDFCQSSLPS